MAGRCRDGIVAIEFLLDLIVAVTLGLISRNGSPLQLIHAGVGTAAIQTLPWAFVPTVLVPFFLFAHGIIFARPYARATNASDLQRSAGAEIGHLTNETSSIA
jgi:hypothetical protein